MTIIAFLAFCISAFTFVIYWWKKRKARQLAGSDYENDETYKRTSKLQLFSGIVFLISPYILIFDTFAERNDFKNITPTFSLLTACITIVAFIIYWWKKRNARINAGEDYTNDPEYKKISLHKRIIGAVSVASVILMFATIPEQTPEEKAQYAAKMEAKKQAEQEEAAKKSNNEKILSENKKIDKQITIESLKNFSNEELEKQVIDYINSNPNEIEEITNYILTLKFNNIMMSQHLSPSKVEGTSNMYNTIPLIGGFLLDSHYDEKLDEYEKLLINHINDYSIIKDAATELVNNKIITEKVYNKYLSENIPENVNDDNYNTKVKIAALNYRFMNAFIELYKSDKGLQDLLVKPGIIDIFTNIVFSDDKRKYKQTLESTLNSINNIAGSLDINIDNYDSKEDILKYYQSKIPKYAFAYDLEEIYFPKSKNDVLIHTSKKEERRRIYDMFNGKWLSLKNNRIRNITAHPENDGEFNKQEKVNYINALDKNEQFADFNFIRSKDSEFKFVESIGRNDEIFISPVKYINDEGQAVNTLVMYINYELLSYNGKDQDFGYVQNLRVTNILRAKDVLVKILNSMEN